MAKEKLKGSHYSAYLQKVARLYQKKEVKIYTNLILSLLTASFFIFFAIKPTATAIATLTKELEDQKKVSQKLQKKLDNLSIAQKKYSQLEPRLYLIEAALPQSPQPSLFFGQLEILAQENHLNILSAQTRGVLLKGVKEVVKDKKEGLKKSPYPSFATTLSLSGSYEDIENFLESLTNLRRVIDIKTMVMGKGKTSGPGLIKSTLEIEVYYLPPIEKNE